MIAKCLEISFEPGKCDIVQGVKANGKRPKHISMTDGNFSNLGHGIGKICKNSRLILTVEYQKQEIDIRIDHFFRKYLGGRLTNKRRTQITNTMPNMIKIYSETNEKGNKYYQIEPEEIKIWLKKI